MDNITFKKKKKIKEYLIFINGKKTGLIKHKEKKGYYWESKRFMWRGEYFRTLNEIKEYCKVLFSIKEGDRERYLDYKNLLNIRCLIITVRCGYIYITDNSKLKTIKLKSREFNIFIKEWKKRNGIN